MNYTLYMCGTKSVMVAIDVNACIFHKYKTGAAAHAYLRPAQLKPRPPAATQWALVAATEPATSAHRVAARDNHEKRRQILANGTQAIPQTTSIILLRCDVDG